MFSKFYMVSEPTLSLTRLPNMASTADVVIIYSKHMAMVILISLPSMLVLNFP